MGIVRENAKISGIETDFPRRKDKFIHGEKKLGVQKTKTQRNKQTKTPGSTDFSSENLRNNQSARSRAAIACFSREHSHVLLLLLRAGLNAVILHVFTPCFG